ncbi:MAG: type sorting protein [Segetibacter sp.]|nr:type sorting protein [Segetibacter sp.]
MSSNKGQFLPKLLCTFLLFITGACCLEAQTTVLPHLTVLLLLPGQETSGKAADGLASYFSKSFDNAIGDEDSYKFTNPDENIGILRNGTMLSIEGRKPVTKTDTLPLKMWKLYQKRYTLKIDVTNLADVNLYLQDSYLHSNIQLNNDTATMVPFTINADAASVAPDRFRIVLETPSTFQAVSNNTLPVELTTVKAYEKNKGVEVAWMAENESNIDRYEVQQSSDAHLFITAGVVNAKNNPGLSTSYSWYDASQGTDDKYYRIKTIDKSGEVKYSSVLKVQIANATGGMSVSTNPGQGNAITVLFKNSSKGNYQLKLLNYSGQTFYTGNISHSGGSANQLIRLTNYLPAGIYQMVAFHEGKRENFSLLIQ